MKFKILIAMICSLQIISPQSLNTINIDKDSIEILYDLTKENISIESCFKIDNLEIEKSKEVWANSNVNIRSLPSSDSNKIGYLKKGDPIIRLQTLNNGWSKIVYNDKICFIFSKYLSDSKIEEPIQNNLISISDGYEIKTIGNCQNLELIKTYTTYVPQNILNYLKDNDWQIILNTENLAKKHYDGEYSSLQGITLFAEKIIEISDREKAIKNALIHEIGHSLDGVFLSSYSTKPDFIAIYNEENQNIKNLEGVNSDDLINPMEYFAESFKQFLTNKEALLIVAPKTYSYMEHFVNLF